MISKKMLTILAVTLIVCAVNVVEAAPMGTAFTYQSHLIDSNEPADGLYDFLFKLYDSNDPCTGTQLGSMIDVNDLDVIDGYFTVVLDFGGEVFDGDAVWLEVSIKTKEIYITDYTTLLPLTELTPVPYSLYSLHTGGVFLDSTNTLIGEDAGPNTTGLGNTFLGVGAGHSTTTGVGNTFIGYETGYSTTGTSNTFLGFYAGRRNSPGTHNTFLGYNAGTYNSTGVHNTFLGNRAGYSNETGENNTFLGDQAGWSNETGNGNVFIGYKAGYNETGSDKLYIANREEDDANVLIYGDFSTGNVGIGTVSPGAKLEVNGNIRGSSGKPNGTAVYGQVTAFGSGVENYGGYFTSAGGNGRGVYGEATHGNGENYGGYFKSMSYNGTGVYAEAATYGVKAVSDGIGLSGHGGLYGVEGTSDDDIGVGVVGIGGYNGVLGQSSGDSSGGFVKACGICGELFEPPYFREFGLEVEEERDAGAGVYGVTDVTACFGVRGKHVGGGTGIQGVGGTGVHGQSVSSGGYGVYGEATAGGKAGYFEGDVHISGELTKEFTTGTSNRAAPIAYASIDVDGGVLSGTPNVSCTWNAGSQYYEITISGENYTSIDYATVVTVSNPQPLIATTSSANNNLQVYLTQIPSGSKIQQSFHFVTYKP